MLIECILLRPGGTRAEIDGVVYHFAPNADGRHVAEVAHASHAQRFLEMPEGYRIVEGPTGAMPAVPPPEPSAPKPPEPQLNPTNSGERDALAARYLEALGKRPHYRLSIERMRAEIEAAIKE